MSWVGLICSRFSVSGRLVLVVNVGRMFVDGGAWVKAAFVDPTRLLDSLMSRS